MINKTYQIRGIYDGIQEKSVFAVRHRDDRSDGGSGIRCYHVPVHPHSDADRHHHDQARKCIRAAVWPAARTGSRRSCSRYRLDDLRPDDAGVRTGGVDHLPAFLPDGLNVNTISLLPSLILTPVNIPAISSVSHFTPLTVTVQLSLLMIGIIA